MILKLFFFQSEAPSRSVGPNIAVICPSCPERITSLCEEQPKCQRVTRRSHKTTSCRRSRRKRSRFPGRPLLTHPPRPPNQGYHARSAPQRGPPDGSEEGEPEDEDKEEVKTAAADRGGGGEREDGGAASPLFHSRSGQVFVLPRWAVGSG